MKTPRIEELVRELRMVANMINMGEKIRWGQETALMDEAADALEALTQAEALGAERERERIEPYYNALRAVVNQFVKDTEDYDKLLQSEVTLMAFERDTGIWPPGKSAPMEMYLEPMEERQKSFTEWMEVLRMAEKETINNISK